MRPPKCEFPAGTFFSKPPSNPTPNLTAEERAKNIGKWVDLQQHDAQTRRKAFEEAAEAAPEIVQLIANEGLFHGPAASGYPDTTQAEIVAVKVVADALRALAEEKPDET